MNLLLMNIPEVFETERLLIRMPKPGDGSIVHEAIEASIKELKPWMAFAQHTQTLEEVELNIRESHNSYLKHEDLRLLVFLRDTGEFVASSGLHRIDWAIPKFEIGYWIDSRKSGRGYMTEAVSGITEFAAAQLKAKRVEIRCDTKNNKSRAIPERLGFTLEGILRNDGLSADGGSLRDTCIYAKVF